jgi:hypothetical protein
MHRDIAGANDGLAVLHSDFEGLWVTGDKVIAFILDERVAMSALHAGAVGIAAVRAQFMLSLVLTLRRGLGLRKSVNHSGECLDLGHQLLESILLLHSRLRRRYEELTIRKRLRRRGRHSCSKRCWRCWSCQRLGIV